jgi:hypothetical protein
MIPRNGVCCIPVSKIGLSGKGLKKKSHLDHVITQRAVIGAGMHMHIGCCCVAVKMPMSMQDLMERGKQCRYADEGQQAQPCTNTIQVQPFHE